jgi:hypothetical protein
MVSNDFVVRQDSEIAFFPPVTGDKRRVERGSQHSPVRVDRRHTARKRPIDLVAALNRRARERAQPTLSRDAQPPRLFRITPAGGIAPRYRNQVVRPRFDKRKMRAQGGHGPRDGRIDPRGSTGARATRSAHRMTVRNRAAAKQIERVLPRIAAAEFSHRVPL